MATPLCRLPDAFGYLHLGAGGEAGWDRKNNPEPWNRLSPNDQYKFLAVSTDYKKLKKDRPDF